MACCRDGELPGGGQLAASVNIQRRQYGYIYMELPAAESGDVEKQLMTEELEPLSKKHLAFVDQYFLCHFNGTEAYMRVYNPKGGRTSARVMASELLAKPNIKAAIETRLAEVHMSADEALELLADVARSDMGAIMEPTTFGYNFDMKKAKEIGFTKFIKKVKQKTVTIMGKGLEADDTEIHTLEIELYDSQAAIRDVLKVHGKFVEKLDVTSKGKQIKGYAVVSPEDWKKDDS